MAIKRLSFHFSLICPSLSITIPEQDFKEKQGAKDNDRSAYKQAFQQFRAA